MSPLTCLHRVADGHDLSRSEALEAMRTSWRAALPRRSRGLLVALRMKGETAEELVGFARAMRAWPRPWWTEPGGEPLLDTCGTGGDGTGTFNISTVAAFVAAGAGVRVAKHGNRSISSQCGSADVLEALGVQLAIRPPESGPRHSRSGHRFSVRPRDSPGHAARAAGAGGAADAHGVQPARAADEPCRRNRAAGGRAFRPRGRIDGGCAGGAWGSSAASWCTVRDGLDEITTTGPTLAFEVRAGR